MTLDEAIEAINAHVDHGRPLGHFLTAVLGNDLQMAVARADPTSLENLVKIVQHCYWNIPGNCWGSYEKVRDWSVAAQQKRAP